MRLSKRSKICAAAAAIAAVLAPAYLAGEEAEDAFAFFLKEAEVVTASKRAQKKSDSPVAIDVITREEIERSGARDLWDLLRFRVGMDVVEGMSIEGNPALVNVRGLPEEFSQSLQVLVDGRSIVSPFNSGVSWRRLPVSLDDIERIEIVRGPNSALFGANAGQGVINILTRKPVAGGEYRAEAGGLGRAGAHVGLGASGAKAALRGSYSEGKRDSRPDRFGDQPSTGDEENGQARAMLRALLTPWDGGELDLSGGAARGRYSYPIVLGLGGGGSFQADYFNLRHAQSLGDGSAEAGLARRRDQTSSSNGTAVETVWDVDALGRLSLWEGRSQTLAGVSLRYSEVNGASFFSNASSSPSLYAYTRSEAESVKLNRLRRAYASEQLELADWLSLALAGSYEGSDTGGEQPAYQGALILKPMEGLGLRLSGSKSPTMPSLLNKHGRIELVTGFDPAPPTFQVIRVEGTDIAAPQVASYEATFSWTGLDRRLSAECTAFQMELSGFPEFVGESSVAVPFSFIPFVIGKQGEVLRYRNTYNIVMRGVETALTFKPRLGSSIHVNHTYQDVISDRPSSRYDNTTPWNKVNVLLASELLWGFNAGLNVAWVGAHKANLASRAATLEIPDQAKVDLRLGYRPVKDVEAYVAGLNLAHAQRTEAPDGLAIGQSYLAGVSVNWGGGR